VPSQEIPGDAASELGLTRELTRDDLPALARLAARSLADPPDGRELEDALFAPDRPALVQGDPSIGVVATEADAREGFVKLLCVDPARRGEGLGHRLLLQAEASLASRGAKRVTVGADAPYFLYPGVDVRETSMLCLLERHHYRREEANFNMDVDLAALPPDPGGAEVASHEEHEAMSAWMARHWPDWRLEVLRALAGGTLVVTREPEGDESYRAFCAYDVNRKGTLGPVAVRPDLLGKGAGSAALMRALHLMREKGYERAEVLWVSPVVPYARVGGRVGRVYFVYRRDLA
jgi:GNAT superfamily N-acetyltransferase